MSDFQGCGHECTPVSWLSKGTRESICWTNQMQVHAWTGPEHGLNSAFPSSLGSLQRRSCRWWCLLSSSPQKMVKPRVCQNQFHQHNRHPLSFPTNLGTGSSMFPHWRAPSGLKQRQKPSHHKSHRQPQASPSHLHAICHSLQPEPFLLL